MEIQFGGDLWFKSVIKIYHHFGFEKNGRDKQNWKQKDFNEFMSSEGFVWELLTTVR